MVSKLNTLAVARAVREGKAKVTVKLGKRKSSYKVTKPSGETVTREVYEDPNIRGGIIVTDDGQKKAEIRKDELAIIYPDKPKTNINQPRNEEDLLRDFRLTPETIKKIEDSITPKTRTISGEVISEIYRRTGRTPERTTPQSQINIDQPPKNLYTKAKRSLSMFVEQSETEREQQRLRESPEAFISSGKAIAGESAKFLLTLPETIKKGIGRGIIGSKDYREGLVSNVRLIKELEEPSALRTTIEQRPSSLIAPVLVGGLVGAGAGKLIGKADILGTKTIGTSKGRATSFELERGSLNVNQARSIVESGGARYKVITESLETAVPELSENILLGESKVISRVTELKKGSTNIITGRGQSRIIREGENILTRGDLDLLGVAQKPVRVKTAGITTPITESESLTVAGIGKKKIDLFESTTNKVIRTGEKPIIIRETDLAKITTKPYPYSESKTSGFIVDTNRPYFKNRGILNIKRGEVSEIAREQILTGTPTTLITQQKTKTIAKQIPLRTINEEIVKQLVVAKRTRQGTKTGTTSGLITEKTPFFTAEPKTVTDLGSNLFPDLSGKKKKPLLITEETIYTRKHNPLLTNANEIRMISLSETKPRTSALSRQQQSLAQDTMQETLTEQKAIQEPITTPKQESIIKKALRILTIGKTTLLSRLEQQQRPATVTTFIEPMLINKARIKPKLLLSKPTATMAKGFEELSKPALLKKAYSVLLKRRGQYQIIGKGLSKELALDIGAEATTRGLGATFKIVRGEGFAKKTASTGAFKRFANVFRTYAIKKGRKIPLSDTFIQKRGKRLITRSEVGEIQRARKGNVEKWF